MRPPSCRVMKKKGIKVGETHCFALLRLCFNRIRALWYPGGYPPTKNHAHMVPGFRCAPADPPPHKAYAISPLPLHPSPSGFRSLGAMYDGGHPYASNQGLPKPTVQVYCKGTEASPLKSFFCRIPWRAYLGQPQL